jgi:hypothetical protein
MNTLSTLVLIAFVALTGVGCAHANFASEPGTYTVAGRSHNPEAMAATLSQNVVREKNTSEYWNCVAAGKCYGYPGGGYGNAMSYHYGNVYLPPPPAPPAASPAASGQGTTTATPPPSGSYATKEELECVKAKADDALRANAGVPLKGLPKHCKK